MAAAHRGFALSFGILCVLFHCFYAFALIVLFAVSFMVLAVVSLIDLFAVSFIVFTLFNRKTAFPCVLGPIKEAY